MKNEFIVKLEVILKLNGVFSGKINMLSEGSQYGRKQMIEKFQPNEKEKHYKEYWAAYDVPRHIYHFSKNGMENLISKKPNWKLRKIKPLVLDSYYISMLSEKYQKSSLFWIKAMIFGTISNVKALFSNEFSSLIYIIGKK